MSIENLAKQFEGHHAQVVQLAENFESLQSQLDKIETKINRPSTWTAVENLDEKKAFNAYLRVGAERMSGDLQNALVTDVDPAAGYLAPPDYQKTLEKNLVLLSPIRQFASVGVTSAGEVLLPKRTTALTGYWVGQTQSRTESAPAYGMTTVPIGEIASYVDVSTRMLDDAAFDVATDLMQDFAEAFAAVEGKAFIDGDGDNGRPEGILVAPGIATVATGAATSVTADALISAVFALAAPYRARAVWAMNGQTLAAISKLKSGSGEFLFQPSLQAGQPSRLLGLPIAECPDMPDLGAGSKSIVVGDFSKYRIFGKATNGVTVLRDPYSQAANGIVRFHGRFRVGASVSVAAAFRIMVTGT